ncbi:hypothetical protein ACJJTC_015562 [Scirpophaga incertulas]
MASFKVLVFFALAATVWGAASEDAQSGAVSGIARERRHIRRKKLCFKYGICQGLNGGFGGGFPLSQGGYAGPPPVQIGISQSQSSANGAGGGYNHGQYPYNYQFNGGYPNYHGYPNHGFSNHGYPNHGYPTQNFGPGYPGYQGYGQGFSRPINNQFNGNFYGPGQNEGYGFQRPPFGTYYDENEEAGNTPEQSDPEQNHHTGPSDPNNYDHRE